MNESHTDSLGVQAWHQAQLDNGRFLIQQDASHAIYYPREFSPLDGSRPQWIEPKGTGVVHATTVVRRKPEAGGDYNVVVVELDEGVRLMSRIEGIAPEQVAIGQRVQARVVVQDGRGLVVFDLVGGVEGVTA